MLLHCPRSQGKYNHYNQAKSAARLCHQVAAGVPDMFCNFYLVKNHKISHNSIITSKAREKNNLRFGILRILKMFMVCLTKFKNNKILLNKISQFLPLNGMVLNLKKIF